jgi:O-acetylserine/cysteine efflux transporter
MNALEWLVMAGINLGWGLNIPIAKYVVGEIPPIMTAALRLTIVVLCLLPWLRWLPGQMRLLMVISFFTGICQYGFLLAGFALSEDVSVLAVVMQLGVPVGAVIGRLQFGDQLNLKAWAGCFLAFAGVAVLTFDPRVLNGYFWGVTLVATASVTGCYGLAITRLLKDVPSMTLVAWSGLVGAVFLAPLSLLIEPAPVTAALNAPWLAWAGLLFSVIGTSLVGQVGVTYLLKRHPVGIVMTLTLVSPVIAIFIGITMRGEALTARFVVGTAVALFGVALVALRNVTFRRGTA